MPWKNLLNSQKFGCDSAVNGVGVLNSFCKDANKIIFSSVFRSLADKMQVDCLSDNSYIHTRLTHTLEVAAVARSIGSAVQYHLKQIYPNDSSIDYISDIVYAAALVHDIGNPPFGHVGEHIMSNWFVSKRLILDLSEVIISDYTCFDGNAQGFRILVGLHGGARLTYATLAASIKYPYTYQYDTQFTYCKKPLGIFASELEIFQIVATKTCMRLLSELSNVWARHPLSFLVEAADDICYHIMDIEDAFRQGKITFQDAEGLLLPLVLDYEPKSTKVEAIDYMKYVCHGDCNGYFISTDSNENISKVAWDESARIIYLRSQGISRLIQSVVNEYLANIDMILAGEYRQTLCQAITEGPILRCIKDFSYSKIYHSASQTKQFLHRQRVIALLMDCYLQALLEPKEHPQVYNMLKHIMPLPLETHNQFIQSIFDYVSGMTDSFAEKEYIKLCCLYGLS